MWILWTALALIGLIVLHDLTQKRHAILRNFPIIGHFRYWLEAIGPELRQYIVTSNNEERPFSRDQRRWVYASSKHENSYFGFGTDEEMESPGYLILKHDTLPLPAADEAQQARDRWRVPCAKVLGAARERPGAFRPKSIVNVSAMSFGSLSAPAIEALNRGAAMSDCLHNTGEGGVSRYHQNGADLIWQLGTGYFGCRDERGRFSLSRFKDVVAETNVRAIEIKLSQGAKPGVGGLLPAAKITEEIAAARGIPMGVDCASPSTHSAFGDVDEMLDFVEMLAEESGLPVGIKAAVGMLSFWHELAANMSSGERGVDFVTIDGGEGGTGAAPLVFSDHVALPYKAGFTRVYRVFHEAALHERVVFIGSGKLGFPESGLLAFGLGADMLNVAREPMMAIGCIQAQRCHTDHCPTGVATQNKWLMRGLDPTHKASRLANYMVSLRKELIKLSRSCGVVHPALITSSRFEVMDDEFGSRPARELFRYGRGWGLPSEHDQRAIVELMTEPPADEPGPAAALPQRSAIETPR
jgi:glutamate synthase (ferredoxin)